MSWGVTRAATYPPPKFKTRFRTAAPQHALANLDCAICSENKLAVERPADIEHLCNCPASLKHSFILLLGHVLHVSEVSEVREVSETDLGTAPMQSPIKHTPAAAERVWRHQSGHRPAPRARQWRGQPAAPLVQWRQSQSLASSAAHTNNTNNTNNTSKTNDTAISAGGCP